jgi:hypothetical protein
MHAPVEVLQLAACAGGLDAAQLRMLKAQVITPKAKKSGSPPQFVDRPRNLRPKSQAPPQGRRTG